MFARVSTLPGNQPPVEFLEIMRLMHSIFLDFMPWLAFFGLLYVLIGIFIKIMKPFLIQVNIILIALGAVWMYFYGDNCLEYFQLFSNIVNKETQFEFNFNIFGIISIIFSYLLMLGGPQVLILFLGRKYLKDNLD
jgi:hypothetical protein